MKHPLPEECCLCLRELALTFHHLIPKTLHKKRWVKSQFSDLERQQGIWVCRNCHDAIHRFITHKDLAQNFRTLDSLMAHDGLKKHIRWAKKQRKTKILTKRKSTLE
ncbi:MAG: hypothetical protein VXZ96_12750 [Myxococcota bacterium]|nr:hypothetical protein [Myxococcota bacterium]MEC8381190.1 hypothetical protein [Myxococcota bacterium]